MTYLSSPPAASFQDELSSGIVVEKVVDPDFQKRGLGQTVMKALIEKAPMTCIHLTSTFGNKAFYHKLGFRFHKSAMALYPESFGRSLYLDWDRVPASGGGQINPHEQH